VFCGGIHKFASAVFDWRHLLGGYLRRRFIIEASCPSSLHPTRLHQEQFADQPDSLKETEHLAQSFVDGGRFHRTIDLCRTCVCRDWVDEIPASSNRDVSTRATGDTCRRPNIPAETV